METYIDFIKKYNNEKSISSSEESEFDHILKGGKDDGNSNTKNTVIKGGFPPVYEVNSESKSFREYSPKLSVVDVLNKNEKIPFLNTDSKEGGFLNIFKKNTDKLNDEKISKNLSNIFSDNLNKSDKRAIDQDSSIELIDNLEIISINKNDLSTSNINKINNISNNLDTSIDLPENIEILSINQKENIEDDVNQIGSDLGIDNNENTTIDLPDNISIMSIDSPKIQNGGKEKLDDSSIDLPEYFEDKSIDSFKQNGGEENLINTLDDSTIDLPEYFEVKSIDSFKQSNLEEVTDLKIKSNNLFEKQKDEGLQVLNDKVELTDSTIDLLDNLEIVSIESLNQKQDGGYFSEVSNDVFDSSIYLPKNIEVITINRDEILDSIDTDSSILDLLDIKSNKTESIGNLFMKNFK